MMIIAMKTTNVTSRNRNIKNGLKMITPDVIENGNQNKKMFHIEHNKKRGILWLIFAVQSAGKCQLERSVNTAKLVLCALLIFIILCA